MKRLIYLLTYFILFSILMFYIGNHNLLIANTNAPVHQLTQKDYIQQWLVIGPFPNPQVDNILPDGSSHIGYYKDYLEEIGGEQKATIDFNSIVKFIDEEGKKQSAKAFLTKANENSIIDFDKIFNFANDKVAYAFCYINSNEDQTVGFLFGSDDGAKVWINGELVHKIYVARALQKGADQFSVKLNKGLNSVLVKVAERAGDWGFAIEALNAETYAKHLAYQKEKQEFYNFLNCEIVPATGSYIFDMSRFLDLQWENINLVEKVMGKFPLNIRWFDAQLNEVTMANQSGRYAFVAEGTTANNIFIRRAGTCYCMPNDWRGWPNDWRGLFQLSKAYLDYIPISTIDRDAWDDHKEAIAKYAGRIILNSQNQQEIAIFMSYLSEMKKTDKKYDLTDSPIISDQDFHLALKRKLLGVENKWPKLNMPKKINDKPATILHSGSEIDAGVKLGTAEKIRNVCQRWYDTSGEPFIVLVARHGVIIIHDAFGEIPGSKMTLKTDTEVASITKLLTGLLFAQFVDQRLISIDDPVGKFLPDFPVEGEKVITLRHCFTHTTGLVGHGEWGSMQNPYLDNVIANSLNYLPVGKVHEYNGMGYDLAGKVMEIVSGKSIFRLFRENFFNPLDLKYTFLEEDLGYSCRSVAGELARFGQLLLNRGSYGEYQFFSPEVFEQLLPKKLNTYFPGINQEWGIGITWMREPHPNAGKDGLPPDKTILSKNVIGHGSATSSILRVDLDNDLVIAQTRRIAGKDYGEFLQKFLLTIDEGLIK